MSKRFIIFFAFFIASVTSIFAEGVSTDTTTNAIDSSAYRIISELQKIREIHEESRGHRQKAIKKRLQRDSLMNGKSETELLSDYGLMSRIEDNTHQRPWSDGWNFYGIAAFFVAGLTLAVSWYTLFSQRKTEGNTKKLSQDMQRRLLNDLLRHLYRDYVILYAIRTKLNDIGFRGYPSEEHLNKMKIPLENLHLDAFYGEDDKYNEMHVLYLNLRNFNEEIEVVQKHLLNPHLPVETKEEDLKTLEFKISYLTGRIIDTILILWGNRGKNIADMRKILNVSLTGKTNASENIDVPGSDVFIHISPAEIKATAYSKIYSDSELDELADIFNRDVREERKKNKREAWKIRIILFP